jgi:hypothetical protein
MSGIAATLDGVNVAVKDRTQRKPDEAPARVVGLEVVADRRRGVKLDHPVLLVAIATLRSE